MTTSRLASAYMAAVSTLILLAGCVGRQRITDDGGPIDSQAIRDSIAQTCRWQVQLAHSNPTATLEHAVIVAHVESERSMGLQSAQVIAEGLAIGSVTDSDGDAVFTIPATKISASHTVKLVARLIGYRGDLVQLMIAAGDTVHATATMCPQPTFLQTLVVQRIRD